MNSLYLARYIAFFQTQVGYGINTAGMLRNILRDNTTVVDRIGEENIDHFITWLKKQRNPDFLDFLGVLSFCEGRSMTKNQNRTMEKLLAASKEKELLVASKLEGGSLMARDRGTTQWVPMSEFVKDDDVLFSSLFLLGTAFCPFQHPLPN